MLKSLLSDLVKITLFSLLIFFLFGCEEEPGGIVIIENPNPVIIDLDPDITHQIIAGFGGASRMWGNRFLTEPESDLIFGTEGEALGLSIFRIRIAPDPGEWSNIVPAAKAAYDRGAKIIACPWSPPASMKTNVSEIGGRLLPENYAAFRDHLNAFVSYMSGNGISIYGLSIQNEPDIEVSYESCDWSLQEMGDFIKVYGEEISGVRLMAPESYNFDPSFSNGLLTDQETVSKFDILAGHIYGGGLGSFPLAEAQGKEIWMTEYLLNLQTGRAGMPAWTTYSEEEIWEESLEMLTSIHEAMQFNWNAYVWWYIRRYYSFLGEGDQGTVDGALLKRGHAFAHFSRYVRPGSIRIEAEVQRSTPVMVTAYDLGNQLVVVIINPTDERERGLQIKLEDISIESAMAVETNSFHNRREFPITASDHMVELNLGAKSVTTVLLDKQ